MLNACRSVCIWFVVLRVNELFLNSSTQLIKGIILFHNSLSHMLFISRTPSIFLSIDLFLVQKKVWLKFVLSSWWNFLFLLLYVRTFDSLSFLSSVSLTWGLSWSFLLFYKFRYINDLLSQGFLQLPWIVIFSFWRIDRIESWSLILLLSYDLSSTCRFRIHNFNWIRSWLFKVDSHIVLFMHWRFLHSVLYNLNSLRRSITGRNAIIITFRLYSLGYDVFRLDF